MEGFGQIFDGNPTALPLPPDAPKEIPSIILCSKNSKLKLEIAEGRVNYFSFFEQDDQVDLDIVIDLWKKILHVYLLATNAVVGRIAVVSLKGLELPDPGKALADHFCKPEFTEEPFNRPESFEIHSHKRYPIFSKQVNSWVRCKTGKLLKGNKPIVVIEQDINTLAEDANNTEFEESKIIDFLKKAIEEQSDILKKYFPDKG